MSSISREMVIGWSCPRLMHWPAIWGAVRADVKPRQMSLTCVKSRRVEPSPNSGSGVPLSMAACEHGQRQFRPQPRAIDIKETQRYERNTEELLVGEPQISAARLLARIGTRWNAEWGVFHKRCLAPRPYTVEDEANRNCSTGCRRAASSRVTVPWTLFSTYCRGCFKLAGTPGDAPKWQIARTR